MEQRTEKVIVSVISEDECTSRKEQAEIANKADALAKVVVESIYEHFEALEELEMALNIFDNFTLIADEVKTYVLFELLICYLSCIDRESLVRFLESEFKTEHDYMDLFMIEVCAWMQEYM